MAKAIAGEAGVPFFYASGSEFEEMCVRHFSLALVGVWVVAAKGWTTRRIEEKEEERRKGEEGGETMTTMIMIRIMIMIIITMMMEER